MRVFLAVVLSGYTVLVLVRVQDPHASLCSGCLKGWNNSLRLALGCICCFSCWLLTSRLRHPVGTSGTDLNACCRCQGNVLRRSRGRVVNQGLITGSQNTASWKEETEGHLGDGGFTHPRPSGKTRPSELPFRLEPSRSV